MIKNTYLAKENPNLPDSRLVEISAENWHRIVEANKLLPQEKRRYFIFSTINEGTFIDRMFIETTYEDYRAWNIEKVSSDRNRREGFRYKTYSLDADYGTQNFSFLMEALSDDGDMEETVYEKSAVESLVAAVRAWEPWAYDVLLFYQAGEKRNCTKELAEKYGISEQAMRKRKKLFEQFCKNFFES